MRREGGTYLTAMANKSLEAVLSVEVPELHQSVLRASVVRGREEGGGRR